MASITLFFKIHTVHVPGVYSRSQVGRNHNYFDEEATISRLNNLADHCYLPANHMMLRLIRENRGKFKIAFAFSGIALSLLCKHRPDVIDTFKDLLATGCVEFTGETYYHSLSWLHSKKEFREQVEMQQRLLQEVFGVSPIVFRNTELIHDNDLARYIAKLGYKGLLCEGLEKCLKGQSPNQPFAAPGIADFTLLLRNVRMSDDIAFRFDDHSWNEYPLTADKFAQWIHKHEPTGDCNINLLMDYETVGIHKTAETGIFSFLEHLPEALMANELWNFRLPSETLESGCPKPIYDVPRTISWEGKENECCLSCENAAQNNTLKKIYSLEKFVISSGDEDCIETWRRLQAADYYYYMGGEYGTRHWDGNYHSPFATPGEAAENLTNILADFEIQLIHKGLERYKKEQPSNSTNVLY